MHNLDLTIAHGYRLGGRRDGAEYRINIGDFAMELRGAAQFSRHPFVDGLHIIDE